MNTNKQMYGTVGQPEMAGGADYIKVNPLNAQETSGVIGIPTIGVIYPNIIPTNSSDTTNSSTNINQKSSDQNLGSKYCYPSVSQDIPAAGHKQYMKNEAEEVGGN